MEDNDLNLEPNIDHAWQSIEWSPLRIEQPKWEYYFFTYFAHGSTAADLSLFNQLGAAGWEFVHQDYTGIEWRAIFKRIKESS